MKIVPIGLKKSSDAVDDEVVKNTNFNTLKTKVNNFEKKIRDASTSIHTNQYNTDKQNLGKKWRCWWKNIRYKCFMTITVLNTKISEFEKELPNTSSLVATAVFNTKIIEVENKVPNNDRYITTSDLIR